MTAPNKPHTSPLRYHQRAQAAHSVPQRVLRQEQLHRVDATQLPHGAGVSLGHCRTDIGLCMGHAECANKHCLRRPCSYDLKGMDYSDYHGPRPMPGKLSARAMFWRCYLGTVAVGLLAVAVWTWQ